MKEKIALGVFIFSVVALVMLLFLVFQSNITGRVTEEIKDDQKDKIQEKTIQFTCTDSDGKNHNTLGKVDYCDVNGCSTKEDSCSGKILKEWFCEGNKINSEDIECENDCDSGACLVLVKKSVISSGGWGGGGSGGGSTSFPSALVAETGETHDLGELSSEQVLEVAKYDIVKLKVSGVDHVLTFSDISTTSIAGNLNSKTMFSISAGEYINMDINEDGTPETYIKLKNINTLSNKAKLILRLI